MFCWTVILVFALSVHQVSALQATPGYAENIDNKEAWGARIVSGWEAHRGEHPHMVSIRMVNREGTVIACGGSVMSGFWILTAAHCTATQITLVIRAGVTNLTRPEYFTETQEYYMYPTYNPTTPRAVQPNDIAVVKLPIRLTYSQYLKPIRIQSSGEANRNYDNLVVHASGFGRTWTNGPQTEQLRWVYLRGVTNEACTSVFTSRFITDNTVCARFFNVTSQSICQGDSGGPLVHISSQGVPILIGVSSFVAAAPSGCHSGVPAAFIRPGPFHSWFTQITGIDFENLVEHNETTITSTPAALPTPTTSIPAVTVSSTTVTNLASSTNTPPTTTTTLKPEEEDIDDPELEDLLKRLEVKVKVKVRLSKYLKKKKQITQEINK